MLRDRIGEISIEKAFRLISLAASLAMLCFQLGWEFAFPGARWGLIFIAAGLVLACVISEVVELVLAKRQAAAIVDEHRRETEHTLALRVIELLRRPFIIQDRPAGVPDVEEVPHV